MTASPTVPLAASSAAGPDFLDRLRALAFAGLPRMYRPEEKRFMFRLRRTADGAVVAEGISRRYTAITLIGLAEEDEAAATEVMAGHTPRAVAESLLAELPSVENLGDVALALWAAHAVGVADRRAGWDAPGRDAPRRGPALHGRGRLGAGRADPRHRGAPPRPARPHRAPAARRRRAPRRRSSRTCSTVAACARTSPASPTSCTRCRRCRSTRPRPATARALDAAARCARHFCDVMGPAGQWWWHYDWRTGDVVEGYPVYAVHQDAMAPMALLAVEDAGGPSFAKEVALGLEWLRSSPELSGGSLVDDQAGLIWRKVARREPSKLAR